MSSSVSKNSPLSIDIRPSRYLAYLLLLSYGGAALLLLFLPVSIWLSLPIWLLLLLDGYRHWVTVASLRGHPRAIVRLVWHEQGEWSLWRQDGSQRDNLQLCQSVNHPLLIALNFTAGENLLLLSDCANSEQLRRLRVRLRREAANSVVSEWSG